jgi:hypothetical protein
MDVYKKNVHNNANDYDTWKSGNKKQKEDIECIFRHSL